MAAPILNAAERLRRAWDVAPQWCWGMSPFGGSATDPAWSAVDLRAFLATDADCSIPQAAFRLAYELPRVARVAVGTSNPVHLRELAAAIELPISEVAISRLLGAAESDGTTSQVTPPYSDPTSAPLAHTMGSGATPPTRNGVSLVMIGGRFGECFPDFRGAEGSGGHRW